jgi:membrane protein DedA with SNARE-associated domain
VPHFISPELLHNLLQTYGLWVLFGIVMLESAGLPLPGETALVATSLYASSTQNIAILAIILVAASAAIIGDNLGYLVGRTAGLKIVEKHGSAIGLTPERLKVGQYLFRHHGGKVVFFGRFIALLRALAAVLAGINRMPWPHFLLMNALGGLTWATLLGGGAYLLGEQVKHFAGSAALVLLGVAIVILVAGFIFAKHHERELILRATADMPAE